MNILKAISVGILALMIPISQVSAADQPTKAVVTRTVTKQSGETLMVYDFSAFNEKGYIVICETIMGKVVYIQAKDYNFYENGANRISLYGDSVAIYSTGASTCMVTNDRNLFWKE